MTMVVQFFVVGDALGPIWPKTPTIKNIEVFAAVTVTAQVSAP